MLQVAGDLKCIFSILNFCSLVSKALFLNLSVISSLIFWLLCCDTVKESNCIPGKDWSLMPVCMSDVTLFCSVS